MHNCDFVSAQTLILFFKNISSRLKKNEIKHLIDNVLLMNTAILNYRECNIYPKSNS